MPILPWRVSPLRYATPSPISDASSRRRHCASASIFASRLRVPATRSEAASNSARSIQALRDKIASPSIRPNQVIPIVIPSVARLKERVGEEVAVTDWFSVSQARIDAFAGATEDHQWIHVDRKRAAEESPYATTVAHGFLTLSLLPDLMRQAVEIQGMRLGINYGLNRVRFPGPLPAGSRVPARLRLHPVGDIPNGVQTPWTVTDERHSQPTA